MKYMTTDEVAVALGIRRQTVASYLSRGQMPEPDEMIGRTPVWKPATISRWKKQREKVTK